MTFEEYANTITWRTVAERTKAKAVWQYQQEKIDDIYQKLFWLIIAVESAHPDSLVVIMLKDFLKEAFGEDEE